MYSPRKVQRPNTSGVSLCMHAAHQRQSVNEQGEEIERGGKKCATGNNSAAKWCDF